MELTCSVAAACARACAFMSLTVQSQQQGKQGCKSSLDQLRFDSHYILSFKKMLR